MNKNFKDLLNQKFGKLEVISGAPSSKDGRAQWNCLCECGKEFVVKGKYLLNGDTTSCGCRWRTLPDLNPGDKFGELTVLKHIKGQKYLVQCDCGNKVESVRKFLCSGHSTSCGHCSMFMCLQQKEFGALLVLESLKDNKVLCSCECGGSTILEASNLTSGRRTSCGCRIFKPDTESLPPIRPYINILNQRFTRLIVIEYLGPKWLCLCDCGNYKVCSAGSLRAGHVKSCGCLLQEMKGDKHPAWKGGITPISISIRSSDTYKEWRKQVYTRDKYSCQHCGCSNSNLNAHHMFHFADIIEMYKITSLEDAYACDLLWDIGIGLTLCEECHDQVHKLDLADRIKEAKSVLSAH